MGLTLSDDSGTKFYIILSGRVGIHIRVPKEFKTVTPNHQEKEHLKLVKQLKTGESFGELAILKNQKRLASAICLEDSHFGVLDKKIFNLTLREKEEHRLNLDKGFLSSSPLFSSIPNAIVKALFANSFFVLFTKNQLIYSEEQYPNACYIIKHGEFTVRFADFFSQISLKL